MNDDRPGLLDQANGMALRRARKERGLTQTAVGKILDVSQQRVSKYERGSGHINFRKLEILAPALGVDVIFFLRHLILTISSSGASDTPQAKYSAGTVIATWRELKAEFEMLTTAAGREASITAVKRIRKQEAELA
ncbi:MULTISPECIES: helix-turn-helix transcriptional regulator [unclassified Bosea (in: a-proteobacteria)]|uniref:helix-turn-helix domain-containing protein n=1 Tax=unclassified Bosea (in: a-proteobacteria) TaxID=2653178 RepID=UPI0013568257|nr:MULTISPECIES: helix-turn-helix transcriptional regulator [unclassified Bosea (in: a-proteobacteria)]